MKTQEMILVSSPDQAGLKTLEKPRFLTPSQLAVAQLRDTSTTRELYLRPGDIVHSALSIRSFKGTALPDASGITPATTPYLHRDNPPVVPLLPLAICDLRFAICDLLALDLGSLDLPTARFSSKKARKSAKIHVSTFRYRLLAIGYWLSAIGYWLLQQLTNNN
jgi:hypothetical protein